MITQDGFREGITLVQKATGTMFRKDQEEAWRKDLLRDIMDAEFLGACRMVSTTWKIATKFPNVAVFLEALEHVRGSDGSDRREERRRRLDAEAEIRNREFEADVRKTDAILSDLDAEGRRDLDAMVQGVTALDPYWRTMFTRPAPEPTEEEHRQTMRAAWTQTVRMHLLGIRRCGWIEELQRRAAA